MELKKLKLDGFMKIFISWSKRKSQKYAESLKQLFENLDHSIDAFMSEVDINGGEDVQDKIITNIRNCDVLMLCFTKENKISPWLLFEAGYARALDRVVVPVLFDEDPNWHSWIDNPMNVARELMVKNNDFNEKLLKCLNIKVTPHRMKTIDDFKCSITRIQEEFRDVDIQCEDIVNKLIDNGSFVVNNPYFKDKTAYFLTGFESFELYKVLIESFMYTGKYLWIYGRKNMKLLSGNYSNFFRYLEEKSLTSGSDMDGIDFRCLFLNPMSDNTYKAHPDPELFKQELNATIYRANSLVNSNKHLKKCFRLYNNRREEIIIRIDNCIIYSLPHFDANGCPQLLTNTAFEVFSTDSAKGKACVDKFEQVWNSATIWNQ